MQNQDSTVISDYTSGLQALLYVQTRDDLSHWNGQYYRETPSHQAGKPTEENENDEVLPNFGNFAKKKNAMLAEKLAVVDIVGEEYSRSVHSMRPAPEPSKAPMTINQIIGIATSKIGRWDELSQEEHVSV